MAKNKESYKKSTTFQEAEIKAFLQLCRGLDKGEINEAYRSKQFTTVRSKFQGMFERIENDRKSGFVTPGLQTLQKDGK